MASGLYKGIIKGSGVKQTKVMDDILTTKILGSALSFGVGVIIARNPEYVSVTRALRESPAIATGLTASICLLYCSVMESIVDPAKPITAFAFKPLVTMLLYAGVVATVHIPESTIHNVVSMLTLLGMSSDLALMRASSWIVSVDAWVCTLIAVTLPMLPLKDFKQMELGFGAIFCMGVLFAE